MSMLSYRLFVIQVWWARRRRIVFAFVLALAAVVTLGWLLIACGSVQVTDDGDNAAVTIGKQAARAAVLQGAASICRSLRPDDTTHAIAAQAWQAFCPPILRAAAGLQPLPGEAPEL